MTRGRPVPENRDSSGTPPGRCPAVTKRLLGTIGASLLVSVLLAADPDPAQPAIIATITVPPLLCLPNEALTTPVVIPAATFAQTFVVEAVTSDCSCVATQPIPEGSIYRDRDMSVSVRVDASDVRALAAFNVYVVGQVGEALSAVRIAMSARVLDLFAWPEPGQVWDAGTVPLGESREFTWPLRRGGHPAPFDRLTVRVVDGDQHAIQATMEPGSDGAWDTRVRWTAQHQMGVVTANLAWTAWNGASELPYHPQRRIRVTVAGPVRAIPSMALLGGMRPGEERTAMVDIAATDGPLPRIVRVETPAEDAELHVALGPEQDGRRSLVLTCTAVATAKRYDKAIIVHCDGGLMLRIPYLGRVYP